MLRTQGLPRAGLAVDEDVTRTLPEDSRIDRVREALDLFVTTDDPALVRKVVDLEQFLLDEYRVFTNEQIVGA